ncbi:MAG: hypothetical protein NTY15_00555 [Planctomycetota bacterium]|nr:hypothetical protein [Planctomycetota bacterium]
MRRVLATLIEGGTSVASVSQKPSEPSTLSLVDQVVSVSLLKNRLLGTKVLEIAQSAVLTPAARDYIRECRVEVVRGLKHSSNATSAIADFKAGSASVSGSGSTDRDRPQRLIVVGTADWMPAVAKQLCSKQAKVCSASIDDTAALRAVAEGIRAGHQAAVMLVRSAHATCWQAARDDALRPAVVSNWTELNDVLREVPANVLILSAKAWNLPSSCNTARQFFQHLQNRS